MSDDGAEDGGGAEDGDGVGSVDLDGGGANGPRDGDRIRYLLVLSRPRFWLYLAGPVVVGVAYGADALYDLFAPGALVLFGYFLLPANVLLYGINDAFDADLDAHNPKKADSDSREARWRGDRLATAAIAVAAGLGVVTFAASPPAAWPYLIGFFALAVGYSAPPFRFKTTPFLDSLSNGLYVLPGAAAYVTVAGAHPPWAAIAGAWTWTMAMHTFSAIPDIGPDREAGIETTATFLGESRAYAYCGACWLLAAGAFGLVDGRLGALLCVYPAFVAVVAGTAVSVERAYWWFPALNTAVGTALTIGGLWRIAPLAEVIAGVA